jgi:hypothetical protein
MLIRRLTVLSLLVLTACGGSASQVAPTPAPPPVARIVGTWLGTLTASAGPAQAIRMVLNQTAGTVTGTWVNEALGWTGNISGTVDASSFTGTLTLNRGTSCTGASGSFSGSVSATALRWSSAGFTGGTCTGLPTGVQISMTPQ